MSIVDDIRIKQTYDPTGENGGYQCETGLEDDAPRYLYRYFYSMGLLGGFETADDNDVEVGE